MSLFDIFKKKKVKRKVTTSSKPRKSKIKEGFDNVKKDMDKLQEKINKHSKSIKDHSEKIETHTIVAKDINEIKIELKNHSKILNTHSLQINNLKPLPKQFKGLQKQFTEFIVNSVNSPSTSPTVHQKGQKSSELTKFSLKLLTPHCKKGFSLIVGLLNEAGNEWLPISLLTSELYPHKEAKKVRNAVSNTIKPLLDNKLIEKKREGNYVSIKLTEKGFDVCQTELSKAQLQKIAKYYK